MDVMPVGRVSKFRLISSLLFTNAVRFEGTVSPEKGKAATFVPRSGRVLLMSRRIAVRLEVVKARRSEDQADLSSFFSVLRLTIQAARRAPRSKGSAGTSDFAVFTTDAMKRALGFMVNPALCSCLFTYW